MITDHTLKTDPKPFQASWDGLKHFEVRKDDRDFQVGETLTLKETLYSGEDMLRGAPLEYTGRSIEYRITYLLRGPAYGLASGWVILSVEPAL